MINYMTEVPQSTILRDDLLAALSAPALQSINFLNEIIDRYPSAISFAPGAPYEGFFDDLDLSQYIKRYVDHLHSLELTSSQVNRRLYQYGPSRGHINQLIADALRVDEGIEVSPEAIVITVGCQEAVYLVLSALFSYKSDLLAIANPCFVGVTGAARLLGIETIPINETEDGLDLARLEFECNQARATGRRIRALYVAPDFSNPGGGLMSLPVRHALLDLANKYDLLLLEDNTYGFTAEEANALPSLKAIDKNRRVILLGTCSKVLFPGVRVGFAVADQKVMEQGTKKEKKEGILADDLSLIKSLITVNTSPVCQAIVGGMLLSSEGSFKVLARDKGMFYRSAMEHLLAALDRHIDSDFRTRYGITWNRPDGGFFVRVRLPFCVDENLLHESAGQFGVLWTPMRNFYMTDAGNNDIRLSCSYLSKALIEEGAARFSRFLHHTCTRLVKNPA